MFVEKALVRACPEAETGVGSANNPKRSQSLLASCTLLATDTPASEVLTSSRIYNTQQTFLKNNLESYLTTYITMTTTTMHFGPEWMRTKQPPARPNPSPPLSVPVVTAGSSSYSALVAHVPHVDFEKLDTARPFKYSKDEMLKIYKDGGGRGGLGLEVERWEGIVREVGCDPVSLKEMGEGEKKVGFYLLAMCCCLLSYKSTFALLDLCWEFEFGS